MKHFLLALLLVPGMVKAGDSLSSSPHSSRSTSPVSLHEDGTISIHLPDGQGEGWEILNGIPKKKLSRSASSSSLTTPAEQTLKRSQSVADFRSADDGWTMVIPTEHGNRLPSHINRLTTTQRLALSARVLAALAAQAAVSTAAVTATAATIGANALVDATTAGAQVLTSAATAGAHAFAHTNFGRMTIRTVNGHVVEPANNFGIGLYTTGRTLAASVNSSFCNNRLTVLGVPTQDDVD